MSARGTVGMFNRPSGVLLLQFRLHLVPTSHPPVACPSTVVVLALFDISLLLEPTNDEALLFIMTERSRKKREGNWGGKQGGAHLPKGAPYHLWAF